MSSGRAQALNIEPGLSKITPEPFLSPSRIQAGAWFKPKLLIIKAGIKCLQSGQSSYRFIDCVGNVWTGPSSPSPGLFHQSSLPINSCLAARLTRSGSLSSAPPLKLLLMSQLIVQRWLETKDADCSGHFDFLLLPFCSA